jgi:poly(glycerol-phosphate) alpha-glucosyltransferase
MVEPGRKVLLYLGRIHPKKGLVNLLRAWKEVRGQRSEVRGRGAEWVLAIAGWDQVGHEAELKRLATELGLSWTDVRATGLQGGKTTGHVVGGPWSVVFLGPQFNEAKSSCYAQCDGFILPSFSEGLPMVVLEAWAYGKPVLMTEECNLPEAFACGAALRIETTTESIATGLREFFAAPEASHRQSGQEGLQLVRERFVWPMIARQMHQLYSWMLGGGSRPACLADF